jgi:hypothetical protein
VDGHDHLRRLEAARLGVLVVGELDGLGERVGADRERGRLVELTAAADLEADDVLADQVDRELLPVKPRA